MKLRRIRRQKAHKAAIGASQVTCFPTESACVGGIYKGPAQRGMTEPLRWPLGPTPYTIDLRREVEETVVIQVGCSVGKTERMAFNVIVRDDIDSSQTPGFESPAGDTTNSG